MSHLNYGESDWYYSGTLLAYQSGDGRTLVFMDGWNIYQVEYAPLVSWLAE